MGPLVVLSERVEAADEAVAEGITTQRMVFYDVGQRRYWTAFEYRDVYDRKSGTNLSAVQPTGTSLIVWSEGQIRRVTLNGYPEAVLLDHSGIRDIEVSPDGTKVAVSLQSRTLLVLDTATGEELLRVGRGDARLTPLPGKDLEIGSWHPDGQALSITDGAYRPRTRSPGSTATFVSSSGRGGVARLPPRLRFGMRHGPPSTEADAGPSARRHGEGRPQTISDHDGVIPAGWLLRESRPVPGDSRSWRSPCVERGAGSLIIGPGDPALTPELEQQIAPLAEHPRHPAGPTSSPPCDRDRRRPRCLEGTPADAVPRLSSPGDSLAGTIDQSPRGSPHPAGNP